MAEAIKINKRKNGVYIHAWTKETGHSAVLIPYSQLALVVRRLLNRKWELELESAYMAGWQEQYYESNRVMLKSFGDAQSHWQKWKQRRNHFGR